MGRYLGDGGRERFLALARSYLEAVEAELTHQGIKFDPAAPRGFPRADSAMQALMVAIGADFDPNVEVPVEIAAHALGVLVAQQDPADRVACVVDVADRVARFCRDALVDKGKRPI